MMLPASPVRPGVRTRPFGADRMLVGILAGAALVYLAGKLVGLGRSVPRADKRS